MYLINKTSVNDEILKTLIYSIGKIVHVKMTNVLVKVNWAKKISGIAIGYAKYQDTYKIPEELRGKAEHIIILRLPKPSKNYFFSSTAFIHVVAHEWKHIKDAQRGLPFSYRTVQGCKLVWEHRPHEIRAEETAVRVISTILSNKNPSKDVKNVRKMHEHLTHFYFDIGFTGD